MYIIGYLIVLYGHCFSLSSLDSRTGLVITVTWQKSLNGNFHLYELEILSHDIYLLLFWPKVEKFGRNPG